MTVKPGLAANWFTKWGGPSRRKGRQSIDTTVNPEFYSYLIVKRP